MQNNIIKLLKLIKEIKHNLTIIKYLPYINNIMIYVN